MNRFFRSLLVFVVALSLTVFAAPAAPAQASGTTQSYLVLYKAQTVPADASATVTRAGGTLVYSYNQIGVAIASSANANFRANLLADTRIEGVSATGGFAVQLKGDTQTAADEAPVANAPASFGDNLSGLQWDMVQIHVPEALAVTGGSPSVVVGDIDTGLDYTHPDLAANVDFSRSVSCIGGVPNTNPAAWLDDNGHGTHTAGTIAAAANGIGIVGVAPNVKIAGIKAGDTDGFFFPEAVICAFMWAGTHNIAVTNNSYFADPWLFNCRNDPVQRAIWKAEQRAIRFAMTQGVTVVAAEGNENQDLAKQNVDTISPDNGVPLTRDVTNACLVIPTEIPGVVGVSADGNLMQKSFYSSYGVGVTQVTAPGGDSLFQRTAAAPNGRVLSTYPAYLINTVPASRRVLDCSVTPCALYVYLQGTSMASPHAAGVAALIVSQFGRLPQGAVQAALTSTADAIPCPPNPFLAGTGWDATCTGGPAYNSFYGKGQINALSAVLHHP